MFNNTRSASKSLKKYNKTQKVTQINDILGLFQQIVFLIL